MPEISSKKTNNLRATDSLITHSVRAKYYLSRDGLPILAQVQKFNNARFREEGWEKLLDEPKREKREPQDVGITDAANVARATRRAKINAFDFIMCNHDLNLFATFTYSPDAVAEKDSYEECYEKLRVWLSNRVQRNGLKYVLVPERTKRGDIHFHAICNAEALKLGAAVSARTGRPLTHNAKPLFNVLDWKHGFTSAEYIAQSDGDRAAVAKYIFKYMGKQMGAKIGGRYVLSGGDLRRPWFVYGEDPHEFFEAGEEKDVRELNIEEIGVNYTEWSFI